MDSAPMSLFQMLVSRSDMDIKLHLMSDFASANPYGLLSTIGHIPGT